MYLKRHPSLRTGIGVYDLLGKKGEKQFWIFNIFHPPDLDYEGLPCAGDGNSSWQQLYEHFGDRSGFDFRKGPKCLETKVGY